MSKLYLEKILNKENLTRKEAGLVLEEIISGDVSAVQAGALLTALRMKGEDVGEILGFIDTMESHMVKVELADREAIDMCGTGGDGSNSFNVSTTAALVVAAGGVSVAKHGNRSISSKCGSADLLEALGVKINHGPREVKKCVDEIGIGFFFAPLYHPAMKSIAPVRRNLEVRTVFNILGPLLNPAGIRRQLIGTFNRETARKVAAVVSARQYKKACTVHSQDGLDEVSPFSDTQIFEITENNGGVKTRQFSPGTTYSQADRNEIEGHSCNENVKITTDVLAGKKGPARTMTVLNAAFGFYVADKVKTVKEGQQLAENLIDSNAVSRKLDEFRQISNDLA